MKWVVAFIAIVLGYASKPAAYCAGYYLKPDLAFAFTLLGYWIMVVSCICMIASWKKLKGYDGSLPLLLFAICLLPLVFYVSGEDKGFQGFMKRIKHDVRPKDLAAWLKREDATRPPPFEERRISQLEWAFFSDGSSPHALPVVYASDHDIMLKWGSDFNSWQICLRDSQHDGHPWQGDLYFRCLRK